MAEHSQAISLDWRWTAVRAMLAVVTGIASFFFPAKAVHAFTLLLGGYAAADGLAAWLSSAKSKGFWPYVVRGALGVLACAAFAIAPGLSASGYAFATLAIASTWASASGVLELAAALRLGGPERSWPLIAAGLLFISLALAMPVTLFFRPDYPVAGASGLVGGFLLALALLYLFLAKQFRGEHIAMPPSSDASGPGVPQSAPR